MSEPQIPGLDPELAVQVATFLPLLATLIVSRLRPWLHRKPKVTLPLLCAAVSIALSYLGQLAASLATGGDVGGWNVAVGAAFGGVSLLVRQVVHELSTGERIDNPPVPTLADLQRRNPRSLRNIGRGSNGTRTTKGLVLLLLVLASPSPAQDEPGVTGGEAVSASAEWQWGPNDLALREDVEPPAAAALEAAPPLPAVTLAARTPVYFAAVGFAPCDVGRSSGPPPPFALPGATHPTGQLDLTAPGVCQLLRSWNLVGCGSLHTPWRQTCAEKLGTAWRWSCESSPPQWVLGGSRCGMESIRAAFRASFGRDWLPGDSEERLASLACCGVCLPACQGGAGCPGPRPVAPPVPDPCVLPPGPVCGDGYCELSELASCAPDCGSRCGNGIPEPGECPAECPQDCGPVEPEPPVDPGPPVPAEPLCCSDLGEAVDRLGDEIADRAAVIAALGESVELLGARIEAIEREIEPPGMPPVEPQEPPVVPPAEPGWVRLFASPAGWSWTAPGLGTGRHPSENVLRIDVPNSQSARAVRASYRLQIPEDGWSRCQSLQKDGSLGPAPKCLGAWLVVDRQPSDLLSYLMPSRSARIDLRYGWGIGQEGKARDVAGVGLGPGDYRISQEARAGVPPPFSSVEIRRVDGGLVSRIQGSGPCRSRASKDQPVAEQPIVPCYPAVFPARRFTLDFGWTGVANSNEGAMGGWRISEVVVEAQR